MPKATRVSRLSWVRLFPEDLLGGITQMDCREVGQYILLLVAQWCAERSAERSAVRDAAGALKSILRGDDLSPAVRAKFERFEVDGCAYLRNQRMSKEIAHSLEEYATKRKGAERSAERSAERPLSVALSVPKPEPQPEPQPITKTKNQDNGHPAASQPGALELPSPPSKPAKRKGHDTRLTPYGDAWRERWGQESEPPWGELASVVAQAEAALAGDVMESVARFRRFLAAAQTSQWGRPWRWFQGLGEWGGSGVAPPTSSPGRRPTAAEVTGQAIRELIAESEAKKAGG